jgi:hypothetical protein
MYEFVILTIGTLLAVLLFNGWPVLKHYLEYRAERDDLVKRYARLHKSRADLLVSKISHGDSVIVEPL